MVLHLHQPAHHVAAKFKEETIMEQEKELQSLLEELEIETIEMDNIQAIPTAAASSGSGKGTLCGSSSSSTCSSCCG